MKTSFDLFEAYVLLENVGTQDEGYTALKGQVVYMVGEQEGKIIVNEQVLPLQEEFNFLVSKNILQSI